MATRTRRATCPSSCWAGAAAHLKGGRHLKFPAETPLANLHLTLLDKLGVPIDTIGDSNGRANLDTLSGV
jgi:hypothetical protein